MIAGSGPLFVGPDVAAWQPVSLAAQPSQPDDPGGRGADFGKSSPVGLLVLLLFFIAVAFLVRSMTKHLKRVPASFDKEEPPAAEPEPEKESGPEQAPESAPESAPDEADKKK